MVREAKGLARLDTALASRTSRSSPDRRPAFNAAIERAGRDLNSSEPTAAAAAATTPASHDPFRPVQMLQARARAHEEHEHGAGRPEDPPQSRGPARIAVLGGRPGKEWRRVLWQVAARRLASRHATT